MDLLMIVLPVCATLVLLLLLILIAVIIRYVYRPFTFISTFISSAGSFSALTLLVGRQEGHLAGKKYGGMVEVGTG